MVKIISRDMECSETSFKKGVRSVKVTPARRVIYESTARSFAEDDLRNRTLQCADFAEADLRCTDFSGSFLAGSSFRNSQIAGCRFVGCTLSGCDFTSAILGDAHFTGSSLGWADFSDCDMSDACFEGALIHFIYYNARTIWPDGITPDSVSAKFREDDVM